MFHRLVNRMQSHANLLRVNKPTANLGSGTFISFSFAASAIG
jgi:hypothetical protein